MLRPALLAAVLLLASAVPALADPCEAPLPTKEGATFSGVVRYSGDGDMICVSDSSDPATWIEVRLGDFDAPELTEPDGQEAKRALSRVAMGRRVACTVVTGRSGKTTSYDRVIAVCTLGGRSLAEHLTDAGVRQGGR